MIDVKLTASDFELEIYVDSYEFPDANTGRDANALTARSSATRLQNSPRSSTSSQSAATPPPTKPQPRCKRLNRRPSLPADRRDRPGERLAESLHAASASRSKAAEALSRCSALELDNRRLAFVPPSCMNSLTSLRWRAQSCKTTTGRQPWSTCSRDAGPLPIWEPTFRLRASMTGIKTSRYDWLFVRMQRTSQRYCKDPGNRSCSLMQLSRDPGTGYG